MINKILLYLKNFDWVLLTAVLLLICLGLVELYSIALSQDHLDLLNFKKQIIFIFIGIAALFLLAFFDYYNWRSFGYYLYIAGAVLLTGVLFFGETIRGTRGWFYIGELSLQPVEFGKFILIIFLAHYFSRAVIRVNPLKHLIFSGLSTLLFAALVLCQPDFGSALILFLFWSAMIVVVGFQKKYIFIISLVLAVIFLSSWLFFFQDYQKQRIITFLHPAAEPLGRGYNRMQAIIAVGAGGLFGRGIGFGSQSQLKFLPEAQNDFIFAVIAEELGFLGAVLVIFLFIVFFYRLLYNLKRVNNDFGVFLILGVLVLIFIEMFINIGMNIGILPIVGISLPFLSYGGSAIVSSLMLVGVVENIIVKSKIKY